jgi:hypothetical protein
MVGMDGMEVSVSVGVNDDDEMLGKDDVEVIEIDEEVGAAVLDDVSVEEVVVTARFGIEDAGVFDAD